MSRASLWLVLVGTLASSPARAAIQTHGPEVWPGKNEISVHLGFQSGMGNYFVDGRFAGGPPGGFKLLFDYGYRVQDKGVYTLWLNLGANLVIGGGCSFNGNAYLCGSYNAGDDVEPFFGVKLKFKTPIPLVPYAKFGGAFVGIFNRYCGDYGLGPVGHIGGGVKYFLTRNIGVGIDTGFNLGPSFYGGAPSRAPDCTTYPYRSHVEFYATFDLSFGAEFVF